jgi:putative MATE family efflux protein
MDRSKSMGTEPIGSLLFQFALPTTASMLVSALYSLVDRIFIGRGVGVEGIAAVTAAFPFMVVGMAIGLLFAVGARSLSSVALGRGEADRAVEAISRASGAAFMATAAFSLAAWCFAGPLLALFGASARVAAEARPFLGLTLIGLPFESATMAVAASLQVQGRPRASFLVNLAGTILNAGLEPLFIFGLGWGLGGAAGATAIAQAASLALAIIVVQAPSSSIKLDPARLLPKAGILGELAAIGAPVFLVNLVSTAVLVVANRAIAPYGGDLALAVIGVVNTVGMVVSYPLYGITNGAQPLFGYNYGARKWGRLERLSILVAAWTSALAILAELVSVLWPAALIGLFNADAALVAMGSRALRIYMAAFALFPLAQLPAVYFQSTGRPLYAGILMLGKSVAMIAAMIVLPRYLGLEGVYWSGPAADLFAALLGSAFLAKMGGEIRAERQNEGFRAPLALGSQARLV